MVSPKPHHHRSLVVGLVLLSLVATLVAGCMQGPGPSTDGLSAQQARDLFVDSGRTPPASLPWHDDMVLVGVGALETPTTDVPPGVDVPPFPFTTDPVIGNGRAPEWFLSYADAASGDAVVVRVGGPDDITFHENHDPEVAHTEHEIAAWHIDSQDAVDRARGESRFDTIVDEDDAVLSLVLMPYAADAAVWLLHAETPTGDQESVLVDATTGRIMQFGDLLAAANPQTRQTHQFSGTLDDSAPEATHGYIQEGQGYDVYANLSYTGSGWPDDTHLDLELRYEYDISWESRQHDTARTRYHWLDVGSGPYTLSVRPLDTFPDGASVQYTLSVEIVPRT